MSNKDQNGEPAGIALEPPQLREEEERLLSAGVYHSSRHDNNYGVRQMPVQQTAVKKRSEADMKHSDDKDFEQQNRQLNEDLERLDHEMAAKVSVDDINAQLSSQS